MNTFQTLVHAFPYGTKLTTEQLAKIILANPWISAQIQDLSSTPIEQLSDDQLYGPKSHINEPDLNTENESNIQQWDAFEYGMDIGFLQYKQGFAMFRKKPIDDIDHDMNLKLFTLGVSYDIGYSDEKNQISVTSQLDPTHTLYIDTVEWKLLDKNR